MVCPALLQKVHALMLLPKENLPELLPTGKPLPLLLPLLLLVLLSDSLSIYSAVDAFIRTFDSPNCELMCLSC
ncbi:hypothetical protein Lalb_Chr16g0386771 [Lupinus albus]|uniref:Uncharacterized protein n=1 Tax=Lupinus albus TaxID=3870 RepID=A0A6A4P795_LUPAL|nr:hypothetical protein Lalb_Chr16g0386771 [Lupinus albus]